MRQRGARHAIVLAGGEGSRLSSVTRDVRGAVVPKQFCSVDGARSLLAAAVRRAERVVGTGRTVIVVAAEHERHWRREASCRRTGDVVVQPRNRGTAAGILLPLLEVLRRDPDATVAVVPSDHFVRDEATLARSLERAFEHVAAEPGAVVLLGITPDAPESDYGWIVPAPELAPARRVERFVEKPSPEEARRLLDRGGAWNSFLFVASARILLEQFQRHLPELTSRLGLAFANGTLDEAYEDLEPADFSRDVLQASAEVLRLESVPACGWTDLGTPRRLGECLAWLGREGRRAPARAGSAAALDLAIGLERVGALAGAAV